MSTDVDFSAFYQVWEAEKKLSTDDGDEIEEEELDESSDDQDADGKKEGTFESATVTKDIQYVDEQSPKGENDEGSQKEEGEQTKE